MTTAYDTLMTMIDFFIQFFGNPPVFYSLIGALIGIITVGVWEVWKYPTKEDN